MSELDDFLQWLETRQREAELAILNGDAEPRLATWSHDDPVTLLGAMFSATGWEDVSRTFRDRFGCWGFLDLWRRENLFTDAEVSALAEARVAITARLRRVQAAAFTAAGTLQTRAPSRRTGPLTRT